MKESISMSSFFLLTHARGILVNLLSQNEQIRNIFQQSPKMHGCENGSDSPISLQINESRLWARF